MHKVKFYQLAKKKNALDAPTENTTYFETNVVLKKPTSILNPILIIQKESGKPDLLTSNYRYAEIEDFGRYYFVENVISVGNNRVQVNLQEDYAATYTSTIKSYTGLIARSTNQYNPLLQENMFTPLQNILMPSEGYVSEKYFDLFRNSGQSGSNNNLSFTWTVNGKEGTTIFNTTNDPQTTLHELLDSASFWTNFEFGITDLTKYITSCTAIVGQLSTAWEGHGDYSSHYVCVGNTSGPDRPMVSRCIILDVTNINECVWGGVDLDIKNMVDFKYNANDFRRYTEPYTSVQAWLPFVGTVNIDSIHLRADRLHAYFAICPVNGDGRIELTAQYGSASQPDLEIIIGSWSINAAMPIPMAVVTDLYRSLSNNTGVITETLNEGVGAWNNISNALGGQYNMAGATAAAVGSMLDDVSQAVGQFDGNNGVVNTAFDVFATIYNSFRNDSTIGSPGSLVDFIANFKQIKIKIIQRECISDDFKHEVGRKSLKYGSINSLGCTGFIQFVKPSIQLPAKATAPERIAVNNLMSEGFYI